MIEIGKPFIKSTGNKSKLCSLVKLDGKEFEIYYEVDQKYEKFLSVERADAFLVGLLPQALKEGKDIYIDGIISEKLYYQLKTILIPSLSKYISLFKNIKIHSNFESDIISTNHAVGTGISAGVDSFYTIYKNLKKETEKYNVTHLTFFNVGSHGDTNKVETEELFKKRQENVKAFADENQFELVTVDSNINDIIELNFVKTHTFRSFSAVLALQKLFSKYYYSSGFPFNEFEFSDSSSAYYDLINVHTLSTEHVSFYSTGATETRLEKVEYISDFDSTYNYLNVCMKGDKNCGKCEKCKRTMLELYSISKLNNYRKVFNLDYFYDNKEKFIGFMLGNRSESSYKEIYDEFKIRKIKIPLIAYVYSIKFYIIINFKEIFKNNKKIRGIYYKLKPINT